MRKPSPKKELKDVNMRESGISETRASTLPSPNAPVMPSPLLGAPIRAALERSQPSKNSQQMQSQSSLPSVKRSHDSLNAEDNVEDPAAKRAKTSMGY